MSINIQLYMFTCVEFTHTVHCTVYPKELLKTVTSLFTVHVDWNQYAFSRASDISRKKKQNFAGFSGANSRKNRPISRDFRGKKSEFAEKSADFAGFSRKKSQNSRNNRPISGDFRGRKVKIRTKIAPFRGILAEKSQFSKDFRGQILGKIGRFHGKFRGKTSPTNNQ